MFRATCLNVLLAVRPAPSDSLHGDRVQHAVIGAAVGLGIGYHRGRMADANCSTECGPRIAILRYPPLYGMLGGAIGAFPSFTIEAVRPPYRALSSPRSSA